MSVKMLGISLESGRKNEVSTREEAEKLLKKITNPNTQIYVSYMSTEKNYASMDPHAIQNAQEGHENVKPVKETSNHYAWRNYTKLGFLKLKGFPGDTLETTSIQITYKPISQCLHKETGILHDIPMGDGETIIGLYNTPDGLSPFVMKKTVALGVFSPGLKPTIQDRTPDYTGEKYGPDGRKTEGYFDFLQALKSYYVPEVHEEIKVKEEERELEIV